MNIGYAMVIAAALMGFYGWGVHEGEIKGVQMAHAENGIRVEEHDRVMQRVGICKWAKIMAEDIRCKTELP